MGALKSYQISYLFLNARDYGSAQNRNRLFIVGVRRPVQSVKLPPPTKSATQTFESIMEKKAVRKKITPLQQATLDKCARRYSHPVFMVPRLTSMTCMGTRTPSPLIRQGGGIYWSKKKIITTLREDMRLQGIPDTFHFPDGISDTAGRQMVGNAMSVHVLKSLLREVLKAC